MSKQLVPAGRVLFATVVSLVFVPSEYLILHDVLGLFRRKAKTEQERPVAVAV